MSRLMTMLLGVMAMFLAQSPAAEDYPAKPIRLIVPNTPGGANERS